MQSCIHNVMSPTKRSGGITSTASQPVSLLQIDIK